jgi:hypothetical protein
MPAKESATPFHPLFALPQLAPALKKSSVQPSARETSKP